MPELPEVETVVRGMTGVLEGRRIVRVEVRRPDLRRPIPPDLAERLTGATVIRLFRRAKYALIETNRGDVVILHLGMSGRVVLDSAGTGKHDHILIVTDEGRQLVLNDPRRFGSVDLVRVDKLYEHPLLAGIGPEPLGNAFSDSILSEALTGRKSPIKAALLDQTIVAGLGNIYVCEALFQSGISPMRLSHTVSGTRTGRLVPAIRDVLTRAIEVGGSSLRDFVQVNGELGYFQHAWQVYGREGEPCRTCARPVLRIVQSGRSTFYCGRCQR